MTIKKNYSTPKIPVKPAAKPAKKPAPQAKPAVARVKKDHIRICLLKKYFDSKEGKLYKKGAIVSMHKDDPAVKHGYDMDEKSDNEKASNAESDSIM